MKELNMKKHKLPGALFTFCGLDGSGKTTIMKRLQTDLEGNNEIMVTKEPTDFVRNSRIFRTYMDCPDHDEFDYRSLSLLAASDRVQHVNKVIKPAMESGKIILSDRYYYSCLANLRARGYKGDQWIYEIAESIIRPTIAFFFDVPVEVAISRVRERPTEKDRYIDISLQHKLRKEYLEICQLNNGILVSTEQTEDDSYRMVKNKVMEALKNEKCNY